MKRLILWFRAKRQLIEDIDRTVVKLNQYEQETANIKALLNCDERTSLYNHLYNLRQVIVDKASYRVAADILKLKDFTDLPDLSSMSVEQYQAYIAEASTIFHSQVMKDMFKIFAFYQMEENALRSDGSREQMLLSRGTINGLYLIEEKLRQYENEHQQHIKDEANSEKIDNDSVINKLDIEE